MMMLMEDGSAVDVAYTALDAGAVAGWVAAHHRPDALMAALVGKWGLQAMLGALEEGEKLSLPHYSQRYPAWRDIAPGVQLLRDVGDGWLRGDSSGHHTVAS